MNILILALASALVEGTTHSTGHPGDAAVAPPPLPYPPANPCGPTELDDASYADAATCTSFTLLVVRPTFSGPLFLPLLRSVTLSIFVQGTEQLTSLDFPHLGSAPGGIRVNQNQKLAFVNLPALTSVGNLGVTSNHNIASLVLPVLDSVGADLVVQDNDRLTSVDMPLLRSVQSSTDVIRNAQLAFVGLPLLGSVGFSLVITYNPLLASLVLPLLRSVGGNVFVRFNDNLVSRVLPLLSSVGINFFITDNAKLFCVDFPSLFLVGSAVLVETVLGECPSLACLQEAGLLCPASPPPPPRHGGITNDPHLHFPDGGRADFRGEHRAVFNFLSAANFSLNLQTLKADFKWRARTVHGTKVGAAFWTVRTSSGAMVGVEFHADAGNRPNAKMKARVSIVQRFSPAASAKPRVLRPSDPSLVVDDLTVRFDAKKALVVETAKWSCTAARASFPFASLNPGKRLLNLAIGVKEGYNPSNDAVAPHGLFGQAYDGDGLAIDGATDTDRSPETTTKAQAEVGNQI